jgi:hypothetical protein
MKETLSISFLGTLTATRLAITHALLAAAKYIAQWDITLSGPPAAGRHSRRRYADLRAGVRRRGWPWLN